MLFAKELSRIRADHVDVNGDKASPRNDGEAWEASRAPAISAPAIVVMPKQLEEGRACAGTSGAICRQGIQACQQFLEALEYPLRSGVSKRRFCGLVFVLA